MTMNCLIWFGVFDLVLYTMYVRMYYASTHTIGGVLKVKKYVQKVTSYKQHIR